MVEKSVEWHKVSGKVEGEAEESSFMSSCWELYGMKGLTLSSAMALSRQVL